MSRIASACILSLAMGSWWGCSSAEPEQPETVVGCAAGHDVGGVCAGAPGGGVCADDICTQGVACGAVHVVTSDEELASVAAGSAPGDCIALQPGDYGPIAAPSGVSVLGQGAGSVRVSGVRIASATGAVLRGVEVGAGGIVVDAAAVGVEIDSVRVLGSSGSGVEVGAGASVSIRASEIVGSAQYGVVAFDAAEVSLERVIVEDGAGPGVWTQCEGGCDCAAPPAVTVTDTLVRNNKVVGVSLAGVGAVLHNVEIRDHSEGSDFGATGGLAAFACSTVEATSLRVLDNSGYGVLIDDASGSIGSGLGDTGEPQVQISGNSTGVWLQAVTTGFVLDGLNVEDNKGVGIGVSLESKGIVCWNTWITGTTEMTVPVLAEGVASAAEVGDGFAWLDGSEVAVDNVTLSGNQRASMLIDGPAGAGSTITNVTLEGGDELLGLVQQNAPSGTSSPTVGAGAPPIDQTETESFAVPIGPMAPAL